jgi:hypothetical protein
LADKVEERWALERYQQASGELTGESTMTADELRSRLRDRLPKLEARHDELAKILDDPSQLIQRLMELDRQGKVAQIEAD